MIARISWRWLVPLLLTLPWLGAAPARTVAASPVLYAAHWSAGLSGWKPLGDAGWTVSGGDPYYGNHTGAADLVAPYRAAGLRNFAVEAAIARIGDTGGSLSYTEAGYGVFVRGAGTRGADVGGGFFWGAPSGALSFYPQSGLDGGGSVLRGADVALHAGFNIFRLDVHGDHYALYENGVRTVQATLHGFKGDQVGVFSRQYRIHVRSFRVIALPAHSASGGPAPSLLSRLPALDLRAKEAPAGFTKASGEYYTNEEVAPERGVTVESLRQSGRLLSYDVEYRHLLDRRHPDKGDIELDATVAAFRTPAGARADYDYFAGYYTTRGFHVSTPGKYGTVDVLASSTSRFRGIPYASYDLAFLRGSYWAGVDLSYPTNAVSPFQVLQWLDTAAKAIDAHLPKQ